MCTSVASVASRRHMKPFFVVTRPVLAGVLSVSQPHRYGILWQIFCVIRLLGLSVLRVSSRHSCLHAIRHGASKIS